MNLDRKEISELLRLPDKYVVIDSALYNPDYPADLKVFKLLAQDDPDFAAHLPDYAVYPDYAIGKVLNQALRLLVMLLYPDLVDVPVAMIEHIKLRGFLHPGDQINMIVKEWQTRARLGKFEIAIENQKGELVYEATVFGTVVKRA